MTDQKRIRRTTRSRRRRPCRATPDRELELKVKKHPDDEDAKVDLGSDESMDASDPISATQPGIGRAGAIVGISRINLSGDQIQTAGIPAPSSCPEKHSCQKMSAT